MSIFGDIEAEEAQFQVDLAKVVKAVLTDENGKPYPWFVATSAVTNQYAVDWETLEIHFSTRVGPKIDIEAITHELGHLMIARDEAIGQSSWGLESPYVFISGLSFDFETPRSGFPQIRTEAKAWAWQYLIEVASGLRSFEDPLPSHPEARFLHDGAPYINDGDELHGITSPIFKEELDKVMATNWMDRIKERFSGMKNILAEVRDTQYDYEADNEEKVLESWVEKVSRNQQHIIELKDVGQGYYTVQLTIDHNDGDEINKITTMTRDHKRAKRFFDIAVQINSEMSMEPQNEEDNAPGMS